jgi:microcystin-dependent protein
MNARLAPSAVLLLASVLSVDARAADPVPNRFQAGAPAKAAEVNANFDALTAQLTALEAQLAAVQARAVPPGTILAYAGTTAPPGFLLCDGAAVSRTTYAALFDAVQIAYGTGDGVVTFNLPDLRGRVVVGVGQGAGLTARTLAQRLGEEAHVLTVAELASHQHGGTTGPMSLAGPAFMEYSGTGTAGRGFAYINTAGVVSDVNTHTHAFTTAATGSGAAHNTMPPAVALNYIIKI